MTEIYLDTIHDAHRNLLASAQGENLMKKAGPRLSKTKAFCLRVNGHEVWKAVWRGQIALGEWTQRGPAQAWIDTCEKAGRFRS